MGYAYTAKAAAASTPTAPSDYPSGWTFPGPPWAPGWPIVTPDETVVTVVAEDPLTIDTDMTVTATVTIDGAAGSALVSHNMQVVVMEGANAVGIKKEAADDYSDSLDYLITNYAGAAYGISEDLILDWTDVSGVAAELTVTVTITSLDEEPEGEDTSTVAQAWGVWGGSSTASVWKEGP